MADKFEKGEVAIYVRPDSPYYGQEVEILSGLETWHNSNDHVAGVPCLKATGYRISGLPPRQNGWGARPEHLRKKKPPRREMDQIVSWEDLREATGWSPVVPA